MADRLERGGREGVFGASDEVLGAIESGVDFEKRIAGIYPSPGPRAATCRQRSSDSITAATPVRSASSNP